jgi:hypothetical protein
MHQCLFDLTLRSPTRLVDAYRTTKAYTHRLLFVLQQYHGPIEPIWQMPGLLVLTVIMMLCLINVYEYIIMLGVAGVSLNTTSR